MVIAAYQVNNVLRVYGDQLRQGRAVRKPGQTPHSSTDRLEISGGARRKALIEKVSLLREKIDTGTYEVDYAGVAGKLVDAFIEDLL